jgi:hypothetical protein
MQVHRHHQEITLAGVRTVDTCLHPVLGAAVAVTRQRLGIPGADAIQLGSLEQHLADAVDLRTVRIFLRLDLGVVLAVHRYPLAGLHAGGEPQPEAQEVAHRGVQLECPVRLAAVQIDGR